MIDVMPVKAGVLPAVAYLFEVLGMRKTIDSCVRWDESQCKLSPGARVKALVLSCFMPARLPLCMMESAFSEYDVENLIHEGVRARDLTDDCLARALDKLVEAGAGKVLSSVLMGALRLEGVDISALHTDTTSISVYGEYLSDAAVNDDAFRIVLGFSKDHRPDLNQFKVGLFSTADGLPVLGDAFSGNTDDKTWNGSSIERLREMAKEYEKVDLKKITYVADSALVTKKNLRALSGEGGRAEKIYFLSRVPATFGIEQEVIQRAWQDNQWVDVGRVAEAKDAASYRYQLFHEEIDGIEYRLAVIHSSKLDKRKTKGIEKRIEALESELRKVCIALSKEEYVCAPDAEKALMRFRKEHANPYFDIEGEVVEVVREKKREKRGRPQKGYVREQEKVYQVISSPGPMNREAKARAEEEASCFLLITNRMDEEWDGERMIREYKGQHCVETSFKFIKSPRYLNAIYLKNRERVEALAYVIIMALFIYQILQRRIRATLRERDTALRYPNRDNKNPTSKAVVDILDAGQVMFMREGDRIRRVLGTRTQLFFEVLDLINIPKEAYIAVIPDPRRQLLKGG